MSFIRTLAILVLFATEVITAGRTYAQNALTWEDFVESYADESYEDSELDTELFETLQELHSHPLNINTVTKDELLTLPFISEEQANDILYYISKNGAMASLGELMLINSMDKQTRDKIRLFTYAGDADEKAHSMSWKELGKRLRSEAVWRSDIPFYTKAGNSKIPDEVLIKSPNKAYIGDKFHHSGRISLKSMEHIFAGIQMEKDAGEYGIDHIAGYLMIKDMGIVKRAIVGNYRLSFGQGLAINSAAKFGKMMMLGKTGQMDAGITKHSSTAEYGYMTGAATTIALGDFEVSAFASYRNADGTFRNDFLGISSLKTDGLHRTQLERSKDGNITITDLGGNVHWENDYLRLSATFVNTHFDTPLAPKHNTESSLYRLYNAQGNDFQVGSIAYSWRFKRIHFIGETAMSHANGIFNPETKTVDGKQNGFATVNTLNWSINGSNTLTAIGRWYGAKFISINGKAFGENSAVQNEEGVFIGWTSRSFSNLNLEAYTDFMYFPWLKYKVSDSSYGIEAMAQAEYSFSPSTTLLVRYRLKTKERDYDYIGLENTKMSELLYKTNHNVKVQFNCSVSPFVTLRTQANAVFTHFGNDDEKGFAIAEHVRWQNTRKLLFDFGISYFNTDSYDSRISTYEPSLLYAFGFTSQFYKGIRTTILSTVPLVKDKLFITAKLGATHYFNRSTIGTGTEMINANHREDLQVQVRWKI